MKFDRLFHVLVLGGAALGVTACGGVDAEPGAGDGPLNGSAGSGSAASGGSGTGGSAGARAGGAGAGGTGSGGEAGTAGEGAAGGASSAGAAGSAGSSGASSAGAAGNDGGSDQGLCKDGPKGVPCCWITGCMADQDCCSPFCLGNGP